MFMESRTVIRCDWSTADPEMISYHDKEWGVPLHDDNLIFEFLSLEGAQAGLSWSTILKRRKIIYAQEGFRRPCIRGKERGYEGLDKRGL